MSTPSWTFLSNHSHVLICIARDADCRVRDISEQVGITERAVQRILVELETEGFIDHERVGRRNHYSVNLDRELRHDLEAGVSLQQLLRGVLRSRASS